MENDAFIALVQWVIHYGYFLFLIAVVLEGPLVTAAAGVAAALGYYNIYVIIALSVLGDLIADTVYYTIGYWSRKTLITRYGSYVGLTHERVASLERLLHYHAGKALVVIKLSPVIPIPGLIMIGSMRIPLKRFIRIALLITLPKSILFGFVGFFAGRAYERLSGVIASAQTMIAVIVVSIVVIYFAYQKLTERIAKEIK
ncbi:MAG: VTT domain-containing protein [bacterium]|nr:VTT domain-containing protein [bacterium]